MFEATALRLGSKCSDFDFSDFDLFIVTPVTRYVSRPCCKNSAHVTNFGDPDFLANIISDLTKLKFQLRKNFSRLP